MDADVVMRLVERAIVSLGLDRPLRPWWLGEANINEKKVRAIIAARPFATVDQLAAIEGIGTAGLDHLRELVTV